MGKPVTPRAAMWIVALFACLMSVLILLGLRFPSLRLPFGMVFVAFWFGTGLTIYRQHQRPDAAVAMMRAYVMPAAIAGGMCGYLSYLAAHFLLK